MDLGLEGKTAVVTGGSDGIGYAIAKAFLEEGAEVVIASRSAGKLERARSSLEKTGRVHVFQFDALRPEGFYQLSDFAFGLHGRLDIWINNVGASRPRGAGDEYSEDDIRFTEAMCFESAVHGSQAAFRNMRQSGGAIVLISSLAARVGTVGRSTLYGPLKAAVRNLATAQAAEYAAYKIRVNCVMPGFTLTPTVERTVSKADLRLNEGRTLLRRMANPAEIAWPVVFLCSDKASYITGTSLEVSGGRDVVLNPSYSYDEKSASGA